MTKEYYYANHEENKEKMRKRYWAKPELFRESVKQWRLNNPDKVKAERERLKNNGYWQQRQRRLRKIVFEHYGNQCICCKEKQYEFLNIDHINNDGNIQRRGKSRNIAEYAVKNNFPTDLQILCWNCNLAKAKYGQCPHKS